MPYHPPLQSLPLRCITTIASHQKTALAPFLLVSVVLHLICLQLSDLTFSRPTPFLVGKAIPLRLRLIPPTSIPLKWRLVSPASMPTPLPSKSPKIRPQQPPQNSPKRTREHVPAAVPQPEAETSDVASSHPVESITDESTAVPAPTLGDILASAKREAAKIARDMPQSPREKSDFRSKTQENIDRQFEAAHAAGGAWFRSARIEEITKASDGNARIYRIVTPFGAFCRTYPGNGGQPMNTTCPR